MNYRTALIIVVLTIATVSCRKDLAYYEIERTIDIKVEKPQLETLWGEHWQDSLQTPRHTLAAKNIGYSTPDNFLNSIYRYRDGRYHFSHTMLCHNTPTPLLLNDGEYKFLIYNTNLNNTSIEKREGCNIVAITRKVNDSILRAPEDLYVATLDSVKIATDYTKLYHHNGVWHEAIKCVASPITKIYLLEITTHYKGARKFKITNLYIGKAAREIEVTSKKISHECYVQCNNNSIHRTNDTLTLCRIATFGLLSCTIPVCIEYQDSGNGTLHTLMQEVIIEESALENGGVITLSVDLNSEINNSSTGGFAPTLNEWNGENIGVKI